MGFTVSVAGASGYAGGELLRLVHGHPDLELGAVCAGTSAGQPITRLHPGLVPLAGRLFAPTTAAALADADLVFLALPHGESAALARELPATCRIVDLGADFRLRDPGDWAQYYGGNYAGSWTYGLPELPGARQLIGANTRIANPGCYATAVALGLAPVLAAGLVEPRDVVVVAASGTSGAGRKASDGLLASAVQGGMSAYKVGGPHQHIPEMEQTLGDVAGTALTLSFTPLLAPMSRGIIATCTAVLAAGVTTEKLRDALTNAYRAEPFVHVLSQGDWPSTKAAAGSNGAFLQASADEHSGRAIVVVAIDNLGKGAAGQAIQNANLVLGLAETTGLTALGVTP